MLRRIGDLDHLLDVITFDTPNLGSFLKGNGRSWATDVLGPILSTACYGVDTVSADKAESICRVVRALLTSPAAAAFTPGSAQQKALPALAKTIPVYAVAGSVKATTTVFAHFTQQVGDGGDLVVDEASASAEANRVGQLGGQLVIDCGYLNIADVGWAAIGAERSRAPSSRRFNLELYVTT